MPWIPSRLRSSWDFEKITTLCSVSDIAWEPLLCESTCLHYHANALTFLLHRLLCEQFFPKTFDGLALIEPVMRKELAPLPVREKYPEMASKKRRDTWPSREECLKQLAQRPFWKRFDPEVLQLYVVSRAPSALTRKRKAKVLMLYQ